MSAPETMVEVPEEELVKVMAKWLNKSMRRLPALMPQSLPEAARWWMAMQEPFNKRYDQPRQVPVFGRTDDSYRIECPYIRRICNTVIIFLRMKPHKQKLVVAAKEDGFWWRGEEEDVWRKGADGKPEKVWLFTNVLREYERQREIGTEAYRLEAVKRMKAMNVSKGLPYDKDAKLAG